MRVALITLALIFGLLTALAVALPWLAVPALRIALQLAGEDRVAFEDIELGTGSLEVKGVAIGQNAQELDVLRVDYRWPDLLHGRVERIEIDGLVVRAAWQDGQLRLAGVEPADEGSDGEALALPDVAEVALRNARIELTTEHGRLRVPFEARLQQVGDLITFGASIDDAGIEGTLLADATVEGALPRAEPVSLDRARASGTVSFAATDASFDPAQGINGGGTLVYDLDAGLLQLESTDLALSLASLAGTGDLADMVPLPWQVAVGANGALNLRADLLADTWALSGPLVVASDGPRAELQLDLDLGRDAAGLRLAPSTVEAHLSDAAWQGVSVAETRIEMAAQGSIQQATGRLDVAFDNAALNMADLDMRGATLQQRVTFDYAAQTLTVLADGPGRVTTAELSGPGLMGGPIALRIEPGTQPLLDLAIGQGLGAWQQHARGVIEHAALHLTEPDLKLESSGGDIALTLKGDGPALASVAIGLSGGALRLPDQGLNLEGIETEAGFTPEGLVQGRPVPITVARLLHGGKPAWFAPLSLAATVVPSAEGTAFEAEISRIAGGLTLGIDGEDRGGSGRAAIALTPVAFGETLQPGDLAPIAAGQVRGVSGELAADGDLTWSGDGLTGRLLVLVDQLGLTVGGARLEQINGVIELESLWPPATPAGQQLAVGLLDLGLPLTEGLVTFQLLPGPRLDVDRLEWNLAGGIARADPFSLGSALEGTNVTLRAEQLGLGPLLDLTRLDGLTGEGSLDGVLPIRLSGGAAVIEDGELAATRPGVLRYASDAAPAALRAGGEGAGLLLEALENFHYEVLRITLDGRTDAEMDIGLHLGGANPDLYDGHPIEFNLDLEGEFGNILRQGVASYQIPDRIRERMQGFGR